MKNTISTIIQCTAICFLLIMSSCGSSEDSSDPNRCEELEVVAGTFIDAAVLYSQDPSVENCKSYKSSIEEYLELIEDCSFTPGTGIGEAQDTIDDLDC